VLRSFTVSSVRDNEVFGKRSSRTSFLSVQEANGQVGKAVELLETVVVMDCHIRAEPRPRHKPGQQPTNSAGNFFSS